MATDYKIVVVPDTGGTRPCIDTPLYILMHLLHFFLCVHSSCSPRHWGQSMHGRVPPVSGTTTIL